jgi:hypothetical protein
MRDFFHSWAFFHAAKDHSPFDILLVGTGGEPEKPWLTIVIDDYIPDVLYTDQRFGGPTRSAR